MAEAICWKTSQRGALALRNTIFFIFLCILWSLVHIAFLPLNEVLKIADSFAYLQMAEFLKSFSQEWLGNGWFGFVYSIPIALIDFFIWDSFLSAKIINIIFLNISALLLWKLCQKILSPFFALCAVGLFFLSPTFLHFNIHVLTENIYIPLFLGIFLVTLNFIEKIIRNENMRSLQNDESENRTAHLRSLQADVIILACLLGLMYLTRAEAFIYLSSIWAIAITLLAKKYFSLKQFLWLGGIFLLTFFLFISPYLYHLNTLTGDWWLTNKWASNLRQAELRWVERMDDAGFEQAVAELTLDNKNIVSGFAGGMLYSKPSIEWSLWAFASKDPSWFISRIAQNQQKLFTQNLPEIFLGKSPKLYSDATQSLFYKNPLFLIFCIIPLVILFFWVYKLYKQQKIFFYSSISFFIPALIFFTLFFTLNRYFLIFLPLMLMAFCFWLENIFQKNTQKFKIIAIFLWINIIWIYTLSLKVYASIESEKDNYYSLKQEAGEWLKNNFRWNDSPRIMERFPIVTHYSWAEYRWITPYTDTIQDIAEYAQYNNLDILVVDTLDFQTYRPELVRYLTETPEWFTKFQEFTNSQNQKVILYQLNK